MIVTEDQVVSLKLAEKLKKQGYPQYNAQLYWNYRHKNLQYHLNPKRLTGISSISFAAPSAHELAEYLPSKIVVDNDHYELCQSQKPWCWMLTYQTANNALPLFVIEDKNPANLFAKAWLHLKEKCWLT